MMRQIAPRIPAVRIDTGYLPPETYQYVHRLSRELDRYHQTRKVDPLHRALHKFDASSWIAGVRRSLTDHRR